MESHNFLWPSSQGKRARLYIRVSHEWTNPFSWGWGQIEALCFLPLHVKAMLQKGAMLSGGDRVTGVGAGGSASSSASRSSSCSPWIYEHSAVPPTSLAPGCSCPDPCVQPALFLPQFPKQEVCCEVPWRNKQWQQGCRLGLGTELTESCWDTAAANMDSAIPQFFSVDLFPKQEFFWHL